MNAPAWILVFVICGLMLVVLTAVITPMIWEPQYIEVVQKIDDFNLRFSSDPVYVRVVNQSTVPIDTVAITRTDYAYVLRNGARATEYFMVHANLFSGPIRVTTGDRNLFGMLPEAKPKSARPQIPRYTLILSVRSNLSPGDSVPIVSTWRRDD